MGGSMKAARRLRQTARAQGTLWDMIRTEAYSTCFIFAVPSEGWDGIFWVTVPSTSCRGRLMKGRFGAEQTANQEQVHPRGRHACSCTAKVELSCLQVRNASHEGPRTGVKKGS